MEVTHAQETYNKYNNKWFIFYDSQWLDWYN